MQDKDMGRTQQGFIVTYEQSLSADCDLMNFQLATWFLGLTHSFVMRITDAK